MGSSYNVTIQLKMEVKMNVTLIRHSYKSKIHNGHKIYLYVCMEGKNVYIASKIYIVDGLEEWDKRYQRIRGIYEDNEEVFRKNALLKDFVGRANRIIGEHIFNREYLSPSRFKELMKNPKGMDFLGFYEDKMNQNYKRGLIAKGTLEGEKRTLNKLRIWRKKCYSSHTWYFADIDRASIDSFDAWHTRGLREKGFKGDRERRKAVKFIKKYLNLAKVEKHNFEWPFEGFKLPKYTSTTVFLEEHEVKALYHLYSDENLIWDKMLERAKYIGMPEHNIDQYVNWEGVHKTQRVLRWFLFQCFTGVRYSDLVALSWKNVERKHLRFIPQKTSASSGKQVRMLLTPIMKNLLGKRPKVKGNLIFPDVLSNQKYNAYLKTIAELAGIDKRITTHVGRHTFVCMSASRGISMKNIKDLIGVTSIKVLENYIHLSQRSIDKDMEKAYIDF